MKAFHELIKKKLTNKFAFHSFKIINDPLDAFNVTKVNGIIYLQNDTNLADAFTNEAYDLIVGFNNGNFTLKITVMKAEGNCSAENILEHYCSRHEFQDDCEKSCGFGSTNGRCKWRPEKKNENESRTTVYNTCVPDINSCADRACDALEKFSVDLFHSSGFPYSTCPQDCTTSVKGIASLINKTMGIDKVQVGHMCICNEDAECTCDRGYRKITHLPKPVTELNYNDSNDSIDKELFAKHPDCGTACILVMIGCPTLLVFMIFFFFTLRRHQVKQFKKRLMLNGSTVSYRDSNDTEIININIINEIAKENYLQSYQKFDFDAKWEFDRSKLILDATLGEGEFGKVMKAYASDFDAPNTVKTVAVKTIKTLHSSVELLALLSEFQLLQEVSHPNVSN